MNWKEFLKPDWRKIVLMVIFLLLSFFGYLVLRYTIGAWTFMSFLGAIFSIPFLVPASVLHSFEINQYLTLVIGIGISIFFWYLLSCIIVWIYDKYKKK